MKTLFCFLLCLGLAGCNCNDTIAVPSDAYKCLYTVGYAGQDCTKPAFRSCVVIHNNHSQTFDK